MILELAVFDFNVTNTIEFELVLQNAKNVISQSRGFISINFHSCIETPNKYVAFINWQTLEDHTIGFRQSDLFIQWRAILSPYFLSPPFADHYEYITT